jgi:N-acetylneuraminic acid mutarotase
MKLRLLFAFFALSLFITSCGSDDNLDGNWIKSSTFEGTPRGGAVSFVSNGFAYVGAGYDGKDCLDQFYKYSIQTGWVKIESIPGGGRKEAVAFTATVNGKELVYVGTGVDDDDNRLSDFYEFDPSTDTWNPNPINIENGPSKRQNAISFSIGGIGYVGTGYGILDGKDRNYLKDFYKFDNGTWTKIAFDGEKSANATTFVIKDKAYVVSGTNSAKYVWEYDPSRVSSDFNGWTRKKYLDKDNKWEDAQREDAISFVISDKAYVATGKNGNYSSEVWEYNPATDDWNEKTSLEYEVGGREDAVAFSLNNRGFFVTGASSGYYLGDMWEFNPTMEETDDDN